MLLKKYQILSFLLVGLSVVLVTNALAQSNPQNSHFSRLTEKLNSYGFQVELVIPPHQSRRGIRPYGLVSSRATKVWINPVVFELGIATPTLVHEAVHVAQLCKGNKTSFQLLDLGIEPPKITHPFFKRYHNHQRNIEAEAYTVQIQPNSLQLAIDLLEQHCVSPDLN